MRLACSYMSCRRVIRAISQDKVNYNKKVIMAWWFDIHALVVTVHIIITPQLTGVKLPAFYTPRIVTTTKISYV